MIGVILLVSLAASADTTRCTWEGRLPDRVEKTVSVSRPSEVARLTSIMRSSEKNSRLLAARSLGELGDPAGVPVLAVAAGDENKHVATEATWAIGRLNDPRVEAVLLQAAHTTDEHVQQAAACGLGRVGSAAALPTLRKLLASPNPFIESAARWSIERITQLSRPPKS